MNHGSDVRLLVVDDDEVDQEIVARALKRANISNPLYTARDGVEALEILRGDSQDAFRRPYLILLDWNMPRMNGKEFLERLRSEEHLADSIVFVFTTSDAMTDKIAAYGYQVAGYIVKDRVDKDLSNLLNMLEHYWEIVDFPPEPST